MQNNLLTQLFSSVQIKNLILSENRTPFSHSQNLCWCFTLNSFLYVFWLLKWLLWWRKLNLFIFYGNLQLTISYEISNHKKQSNINWAINLPINIPNKFTFAKNRPNCYLLKMREIFNSDTNSKSKNETLYQVVKQISSFSPVKSNSCVYVFLYFIKVSHRLIAQFAIPRYSFFII